MSIPPDLAELLGTVATPLPALTDVVSPPTALAVASVGGDTAYEGANQFDGLQLWGPSLRSADAEIIPEKGMLDARVRDTLRNDAYVAGGATLHKDNIVGALFLLNAKPETRILWGRDDDIWEQEFQEEIETKFLLWSESSNNWMDAQRTKGLTDFVRLAVGTHTAGGEVLASAEWMPDDGRPFRTAVQMIDTDRLSNPMNSWFDNNIRGGVERDRRGAPIAYHIRGGHPSDYANAASYKWTRVMARKPWGRQMILHIYEQMRPDQSRGISAMVAALSEMKMTKGFRKVELQRAVVASTYAASIESDLPNADVYRLMGGEDDSENPAVRFMTEYLAAINEYTTAAKHVTVGDAKIPVYPPGTKLKLQNPGNAGPLGDKFEASLLRYIAANLGLSYEQLSRDYTQTNYSSARAAMGETWKHMLARKKIVADGTASFIYRLWLEEAINSGEIESLKRRNVPNFYEGLNQEAYTACEWIGAGQGQIDPLKETQAAVLKMKYGLSTKEVEIARLSGQDWRKVARQIARERLVDEQYGNATVGEASGTGQDMENALSGSPQEREG